MVIIIINDAHQRTSNARCTYGSEFFNIIIGCAERCQTDFLRELGERRIGEQRNVTEQFVADIWFGRVQRFTGMPNVLRRMEDTEREAGKEITWWQQTSHRSQCESSTVCWKKSQIANVSNAATTTLSLVMELTFQEIRNVLQLRNVVFAIAAILDQQREHVVMLAARMCLVQLCNVAEHNAPCIRFLLRVFHVRQYLSIFIIERNVSKILSVYQ